MAFDTIRQVFGQMAMKKAVERSPMGQIQMQEAKLRNRMLEMQMDELMPLQVEHLKKQIDFMVSPREAFANEIAKESLKQQLIQRTQELNNAQVAARTIEKAHIDAASRAQVAAIPRTVYHQSEDKFPITSLAGKYTPESIAAYRTGYEAGAPDESLLMPVAGAAGAAKPMSENQRQSLASDVMETGEFESLKNDITGAMSSKKTRLGMDWAAEDAAPFKNDTELILQLQATNFPEGESWRALGTPSQLRKKYPVVANSIDRIRGIGPSQASAQMSSQNLININGAMFRDNGDGTFTRMK